MPPPSLRVAGQQEVLGGVEEPTPSVLWDISGGQARRQLRQLACRVGSAPTCGQASRLIKHCCHSFVRGGRGQGEVACPFLGFSDHIGQVMVYVPASPRRGELVGSRGQQGVREQNAVALEDNQPGVRGLSEAKSRLLSKRG